MKKIIIVLAVLLISACSNDKNQYRVEVETKNGPDNVMVLNNWFVSSDTSELENGNCVFTGTIDSFPKLVSVGFPFPSHEKTRLVLEPGTINVKYTKEDGFTIGGTENNERLRKIWKELEPYNDSISEYWGKWNRAYRKKNISTPESEEVYEVYLNSKKVASDKRRELIQENPNYAGLVITLPIVRNETPENLKFYLDHFKQFSNDRRYKRIKEQYEAAERTAGGNPFPDFTFPNPEGELVSLSDFRGKWVVLDLWYSGCPWCRKMTPHLIDIYYDWKDERDFEIISLSVDKPKDYDKWLEAIEEDGAPWTQVLDSTKKFPKEQCGVTGYPSLFIIDKEGNGHRKILGYHAEKSLRKIFNEYMQ